VTERGKKGAPLLTIKVDARAAEKFFYSNKEEEEKSIQAQNSQRNFKVHCYLVESLSTSVREFRTLRMAEFMGGFT
jgi:hypothetical protein